MADQDRVLLPSNVRPGKYRVTLSPDLERFTFCGSAEIEVEVTETTSQIVLHAAEMEIDFVELARDADTISPARIQMDEEKETATFEFPQPLPPGPGLLRARFRGKLNDQMRGFYRSSYVVNGETRTMAVTQFEATDARRAFPCWDEPAVKATFEVTLEIPADRTAISNMPVVETRAGKQGQKVLRFAPSPVMSTYLLAFIVGEFDFVEGQTAEGVQVRVYTPVGKKEQGWFALDVATRTLSFFHDYFDISYPLPKMDLVAIADFAAGAMENWGAVTYRETAILVEPEHTSEATKQRVAVVIAHELAHQWFGNLVTMEWWTHLWLNEGFASWIEYLAVDYLFPEWDIWTQFVFSDWSRALGLDGLENTHPIEVEVRDPNQISEIFDAISYSKGASIIRMLEAFLGEDVFRQGLHLYLTRHQYGNATTEDLWAALAEASGQPVKEMMDTWTKQPGYPVVTLECTSTSTLHQSRFFGSGKAEGKGDSSRWWVPVSITTAARPEAEFHFLREPKADLGLPVEEQEWVKINWGQTGFYRVNYPPAFWARLRAAVRETALPAPDRLGLQNDAFALARSGQLGTPQVLTLVSAYQRESDYTVWADLSTNLEHLAGLLSEEPCFDGYRAFGRHLYRPLAERLGWERRPGEAHLITLLRSLVIGELGDLGDEETMEQARRQFLQFQEERRSLPPDLRFPVYKLVVESGGEDAYEAILQIFRASDLHEEKIRCLRSLGFSQKPELLQRTLDFSLSREVRFQDTPFVIGSVAFNRYGRELAWQFLQREWTELNRRYGKGGFLLARIISSTTENFTTDEKAREVEEFFQTHPVPAAERTIRQSLERIRSNVSWLRRDGEAIQRWLEEWARSNGQT